MSLIGCSEGELEKNISLLLGEKKIEAHGNYMFAEGKGWSVAKRIAEEKHFQSQKKKIRFSAWIISHFPFVRSILFCGSSAKGIFDEFDDLDFFVIAKKNRLWLCRTIITVFRRAISMNYRSSNYRFFCCNYFLSEENLLLPEQNEFNAIELFFSQPAYNIEIYRDFIKTNKWAEKYFSIRSKKENFLPLKYRIGFIQKGLESIADIFWNDNLEKKIMQKHCRRWIQKKRLASVREFDRRATLTYIKPDAGFRQQFFLNSYREFDKKEHRSKIRTKILLKKISEQKYSELSRRDILLTHAYYLGETKSEKKIMKPYVPLGPLYLAAHLKSKNYNTGFYDTTFLKGPEIFAEYISSHTVPLVGIYVLETTRKNALEMIKSCRCAGTVVIVGGPAPSADPQFYLDHGANLVIVGEAENTLSELLEAIKTGDKNIMNIDGVYSAKGFSMNKKLIENLDAVPFPARELVDFNPYFNVWRKYHKTTSILINTSRGCPYDCNWCSKPVFGSTFRQRSAKNVAEEMAFIKKTYNPGSLWFTDDIFGLDKNWVSDFCKEISSRNARIPFECLLRVDMVTSELLRQLKDAGCYRIWYGVESGSQKVLDSMNKKIKVENIIQASDMTKDSKIELGFFVMLGYPGEKFEDIELTRKMLRECVPDHCGSVIAYPYSGTIFYERVKTRLKFGKNNFRIENDNRISFAADYPQYFYDIARRLINKEVYINKNQKTKILDRVKYGAYKFIYGAAKNALSGKTGMHLER